MNKKIFFFFFLIVISVVSVPLFAGVSVDLGATFPGNAVYQVSRPLGAIAGIGITLFDNKAVVQIIGGILSPPLGDGYNDPAGILSAGILFAPIDFLYLGFRTGLITPPDEYVDYISYGSLVFRVQNPGKGVHYFAETEVSFSGVFNRFSMGLNFTF